MNKELESYKSSLERKTYISKTRFDTEFSIYRSLSQEFFKMLREINVLVPCGYSQVSANEEIRKKQDEENYKASILSIIEAQDMLNSNAPFISDNFYNRYDIMISQHIPIEVIAVFGTDGMPTPSKLMISVG